MEPRHAQIPQVLIGCLSVLVLIAACGRHQDQEAYRKRAFDQLRTGLASLDSPLVLPPWEAERIRRFREVRRTADDKLAHNEGWRRFKSNEGAMLTLRDVNSMLGPGILLTRRYNGEYVGRCYDEQYAWRVEGVLVVMNFFSCYAIEHSGSAIFHDAQVVYGQ